jgi:hypothetical protein
MVSAFKLMVQSVLVKPVLKLLNLIDMALGGTDRLELDPLFGQQVREYDVIGRLGLLSNLLELGYEVLDPPRLDEYGPVPFKDIHRDSVGPWIPSVKIVLKMKP